jgi:hypothetical protein
MKGQFKMKNQKITFTTIVIAVGCVALCGVARAVVPPPDGGYPGGNTAEGQNALLSQTTGGFNTAIGWLSLRGLTTASFNTAVGAGTLVLNNADNNTAIGTATLLLNTTGAENTATGTTALFSNTEGEGNTAVGFAALFGNTTGLQNTAIGLAALQNSTTGNGNIALGTFSGGNVTTSSNVICIGASGENVDNSCYISNIFGQPSPGGAAVSINAIGKLGTTASSGRFKEEIKPMDEASEVLYALKPVTFRYKKKVDPAGTRQLGLVAEDVEKVNPDLIVRDKDGKPYSVRYDQVNAMLLNEFLKEHRTVQAQQEEIDALKQELKDQRAFIEKLNARIELDKAAPHLVVDRLQSE